MKHANHRGVKHPFTTGLAEFFIHKKSISILWILRENTKENPLDLFFSVSFEFPPQPPLPETYGISEVLPCQWHRFQFQPLHTVDGRNPPSPGMVLKPCK